MEHQFEKLLYSRADAAAALSISIRSVEYLISEGKLSTCRIGRTPLFLSVMSDVLLARITPTEVGPTARSKRMKRDMARGEKKLRGIYENPPNSGIFYVQYFDSEGRRRREKAGRRLDAITLLAKRRTEKVPAKETIREFLPLQR